MASLKVISMQSNSLNFRLGFVRNVGQIMIHQISSNIIYFNSVNEGKEKYDSMFFISTHDMLTVYQFSDYM